MFGRKPGKTTPTPEPIATQPPDVVFPWPAGTTLTALDDAILALPRGLIGVSETIGSILRGDDDMEVSIPEPGDRFLIRLRAGMAVTISRSCQACVVSDDGTPKRFKVARA